LRMCAICAAEKVNVADSVERGGCGVAGAGVRFGAGASKLQPATANNEHSANMNGSRWITDVSPGTRPSRL
jgi:hypothetical protein